MKYLMESNLRSILIKKCPKETFGLNEFNDIQLSYETLRSSSFLPDESTFIISLS